MPLLEADGGVRRTMQMRRKRRKEPVAPAPRLQPAADVAPKVVAAYYRKTGRFPSGETTFAVTKAVQADPTIVTQEDVDSIFPNWVRASSDPADVSEQDLLLNPAKAAYRKRNKRPRWTKEELAQRPFRNLSGDETRALALTTIYGERMTSSEISDINAAREWYDPQWGAPGGGTQFKARMYARQAGIHLLSGDEAAAKAEFFHPDGTPNQRGVDRWSQWTDQSDGSLMDPSVYSRLREGLEGRDREELSQGNLADLDALAARLSRVYRGFAAHYAGQKSNVRWDAYFDEHFTRYILEANAAYAVGLCVTDPDGKKQQQARRNIEIATRGAVKSDADIHEALAYMNITGQRGDTESPMERLGRYLWNGYKNAHAEMWGDRRAAASYAHDFGVEALPYDVRLKYITERRAWQSPLRTLAAGTKTIEGGESITGYEAFIESLADSVYNPDEYTLPMSEGPAEPEEKEPRTTHRIGGKGYGARQRVISTDDPLWRFTDTVTVPFIEDVLEGPVGSALDAYERQKVRLWLVMALTAARDQDRKERLGISSHGRMAAGGKLARQRPEIAPLPDDYRGGSVWTLADRLMGSDPAGGEAFMHEYWRQQGWDPEKHKNVFFMSNLVWSIGCDIPLDAGLGAAARLGVGVGARVARATLSPRLAAKVAAAEREVAVAAGAASDLAREGKPIEKTGMAAMRLRRAQSTLALLKRPAWYDTYAIALSKGTQEGHQVAEFLGVADTIDVIGRENPKAASAALKLLERVGKSRDADEVLELMNELNHAPYGLKLDPGAVWFGKNVRYQRIMSMQDDLAYFRETVDSGKRVRYGVEKLASHLRKYGTLTRMGFADTEEGRRKAAELISQFLRRWSKLEAENADELILRKRELWDEMWETVEANMRARTVTAKERKVIETWARRNGMSLDDGWDKSAWDAFRAADQVSAPKAKRTTPMGKSSTHVDEAIAAEAGLEDTGRAAHEFQLAHDLLFPVNPQKLIAFQRGSRSLSWELRQTTPIFRPTVVPIPFVGSNWRRFGPSPDAVTTTFKQLVIGHPMFALTVVGIDEFWRPQFQAPLWRRLLDPKRYKAVKDTPGMEGALRRVMEDDIRRSLSVGEAFIPMTPETLDNPNPLKRVIGGYAQHFNPHTEALSQETTTEVLRLLPRKDGESLDDWVDRLLDACTDLAMGNKNEAFAGMTDDVFDDLAAHYRIKLQQMGGDFRSEGGAFVSPGELAAANADNSTRLQQAWDDIAEAHGEIDALDDEARELRKAILGKEDKHITFNKPSKGFTAEWKKLHGIDEVDDEAAKALRADWQDAVMDRRGKSAEWARYKTIREERKPHSKRLREAQALRKELENAGTLRCEPGSRMEQLIRYNVLLTKRYMADDVLLDALLNNKKLTRAELKAANDRLKEQGMNLPTIMAVKSDSSWGPGSIPGLTQFNNATTVKLMDKISNAMGRLVFIDNFGTEYDRLVALGLRHDEAFTRASAVAQRAAERALYQHAAAPIENAGRNVMLFLPAYRQAAVSWAKTAARHPVIMGGLRQKFADDYPMMRFGDYQMSYFMPFWLSGDISEVDVPGLGPMIIVPLRMVNSWTGYTETDEGKFTYTGATDLDWMRGLPPLSFINKSTSPAGWTDDLVWGLGGDKVMYAFGEDQGFLGRGLGSMLRGVFRDQQSRTQFAINIANAQIANGVRPDYTRALREMRETPGLMSVFESLSGALRDGGHPEGLLAAFTKLFSISRVAYKPADAERRDLGLFERIFGDEAVTIMDAQYEYYAAYGDREKQEAILQKVPKLRPIIDFYYMNARERAEYLSQPEHQWIMGYVQGRNTYAVDGKVLVGAEYERAMKNGQIYRKKMDEYWAGLESDWVNLGWTQQLAKLEADQKADLATAHKWLVSAAKREAATPEHLERLLAQLDYWERFNSADNPRADIYSNPTANTSLAWATKWAKKDGIYDDVFRWNPYAIKLRFNEAVQMVGGGGDVAPVTLGEKGFPAEFADIELPRQRPQGADRSGIEGKWSNDAAYGGRNWPYGMGKAREIVDVLYKYAPPEFKPAFDVRRSTSWARLNETDTENAEYDKYLRTKKATGPYYYLENPSQEMEALGFRIKNHDRFDAVVLQAARDYEVFKAQTKNMSTNSKEYMALRNARIARLDRMFAVDDAEPLRHGVAGRLRKTYLTQPGAGLKVNHNFVSRVAARMMKGADPAALVAAYEQRKGGLTPQQSKRVRTATYWDALLATAVLTRAQMKSQMNGPWRGISPTSKAGAPYVARVRSLAHACSRLDEEFRKQYEGMGGDKAILDWLDLMN